MWRPDPNFFSCAYLEETVASVWEFHYSGVLTWRISFRNKICFFVTEDWAGFQTDSNVQVSTSTLPSSFNRKESQRPSMVIVDKLENMEGESPSENHQYHCYFWCVHACVSTIVYLLITPLMPMNM